MYLHLQEEEDPSEFLTMLMQLVRADYQVYILALSSLAAKYGFSSLTQQALLLDLRIKIL